MKIILIIELKTCLLILLFFLSSRVPCMCSQTNYSLNANRAVRILDACKLRPTDTDMDIVEGIFPKKSEKPSKFLVSFPSHNYTGEYWVLKTDYKVYSVVADPNRTSLWFLSRTPDLADRVYNDLHDFAKARNFAVEKLLNATQNCGSFV